MGGDPYEKVHIDWWDRQIHYHNRVFKADILLPIHVIIERDASGDSSVMVTLQVEGATWQMTARVESFALTLAILGITTEHMVGTYPPPAPPTAREVYEPEGT